jgi:hypothetical protein
MTLKRDHRVKSRCEVVISLTKCGKSRGRTLRADSAGGREHLLHRVRSRHSCLCGLEVAQDDRRVGGQIGSRSLGWGWLRALRGGTTSPQLLPLLDAISSIRGLRGRPAATPTLCADLGAPTATSTAACCGLIEVRWVSNAPSPGCTSSTDYASATSDAPTSTRSKTDGRY